MVNFHVTVNFITKIKLLLLILVYFNLYIVSVTYNNLIKLILKYFIDFIQKELNKLIHFNEIIELFRM